VAHDERQLLCPNLLLLKRRECQRDDRSEVRNQFWVAPLNTSFSDKFPELHFRASWQSCRPLPLDTLQKIRPETEKPMANDTNPAPASDPATAEVVTTPQKKRRAPRKPGVVSTSSPAEKTSSAATSRGKKRSAAKAAEGNPLALAAPAGRKGKPKSEATQIGGRKRKISATAALSPLRMRCPICSNSKKRTRCCASNLATSSGLKM